MTVRLAFTLQYVFWETGIVNNDVSGDSDSFLSSNTSTSGDKHARYCADKVERGVLLSRVTGYQAILVFFQDVDTFENS